MAAHDHEILHCAASYTPTLPYEEKRKFDSPRIHVPPAEIDYQNGHPSLQVSRRKFVQTSSEYGTPSFINSLNACSDLSMSHSMLSWQYEMRRTAQNILPYIALGPSSAARDRQYLSTKGITLMLAVRSIKVVEARPAFLNPTTFSSNAGINTIAFDFDTTLDFIAGFRPIIKYINDHLETTCANSPIRHHSDILGKVLIFCESGNDRSAVLVAAYLMITLGVTAVSAIQIVQSQRFCISMSDEMKNILINLQYIIDAERSVTESRAATPTSLKSSTPLDQSISSGRSSQKRDIDLVDSDDEMDHDIRMDMPVRTRKGIAPFIDAPY